jgi:hypothetical protein
MWMDESEPDHAKDITGGQWDLHKGLDAEVLPAWVYDWTKGFQVCARVSGLVLAIDD